MFTMMTSEGFTQAEVDILNDVMDDLADMLPDCEAACADLVNNAWAPGDTADALRGKVILNLEAIAKAQA